MTLHTTYFGPVAWYAQIARGAAATVSTADIYRKQTDRNRCRIMTANGPQLLTVPVTLPASSRGGKCPICQVRISDHGNWRHLHWQALQSAYGMSPFFDYYADDLRQFFEPQWDNLFDYNMEITRTMLRLLGLPDNVTATTDPVSLPSGAPDTVDIRYYQTFQRRHGFQPGMSILDLLCNEGPEAVLQLIG